VIIKLLSLKWLEVLTVILLLSNSYTGLDAPATTRATTYDVRLSASNDGGTATLYLNRSSVDSDIDRVARGSSSITLMEIGV
jgi:hypothetical protein